MKNLKDLRPYDFLLVDAMNLLARHYYGRSNLSYNGKKTGMMYGLVRAILEWRRIHPRAEIYMLWEGRLSIRKKKYPFYKAKRATRVVDTEFGVCLKEVQVLMPHLGVTEFRHIGLEADDLAAYFVGQRKTGRYLLVSTDQDWWAYTNEDVDLLCRTVLYTYEMLKNKLGFDPHKLDLWKMLKGDKSDEIPGIPRFPTKLAIALMETCETSLDFKWKLCSMRAGTWAKRVKAYWWQIEENADLVRPLEVQAEHLEADVGVWERAKIRETLLENGMTGLVEQLDRT